LRSSARANNRTSAAPMKPDQGREHQRLEGIGDFDASFTAFAEAALSGSSPSSSDRRDDGGRSACASWTPQTDHQVPRFQMIAEMSSENTDREAGVPILR